MKRQDRGASWTPEQMAELMRLARQNLSAEKIAVQLGRTEEAIQLKARQSGVVLNDGGHTHGYPRKQGSSPQ